MTGKGYWERESGIERGRFMPELVSIADLTSQSQNILYSKSDLQWLYQDNSCHLENLSQNWEHRFMENNNCHDWNILRKCLRLRSSPLWRDYLMWYHSLTNTSWLKEQTSGSYKLGVLVENSSGNIQSLCIIVLQHRGNNITLMVEFGRA